MFVDHFYSLFEKYTMKKTKTKPNIIKFFVAKF